VNGLSKTVMSSDVSALLLYDSVHVTWICYICCTSEVVLEVDFIASGISQVRYVILAQCNNLQGV